MTPPPAIVALMRTSSSSSPLIASCRCLGVILLTKLLMVPNTLKILRGVAGQLEDFGSEVFEDGGSVHSRCGSDSILGGDALLQVAVNTTDGELV